MKGILLAAKQSLAFPCHFAVKKIAPHVPEFIGVSVCLLYDLIICPVCLVVQLGVGRGCSSLHHTK